MKKENQSLYEQVKSTMLRLTDSGDKPGVLFGISCTHLASYDEDESTFYFN